MNVCGSDEQQLLPAVDVACAVSARNFAAFLDAHAELLPASRSSAQKAHIVPRALVFRCRGCPARRSASHRRAFCPKQHDLEQDGHRVLLVDALDGVGKNGGDVDIVDIVAGRPSGAGMVLSSVSSLMGLFAMRSIEPGPDSTPCEAQAYTSVAPPISTIALAALHREPAVSTMSSNRMQLLVRARRR